MRFIISGYHTPVMARPRQKDGRVHGVVVAFRREDGRWLCIRRSAAVSAPLKVCFPGGAIEAGETQEAAAVREMREELGMSITPVRCVWRWDSPTASLTLWGWTATRQNAHILPDPAEVAEVLWLTSDEVIEHPDAMPTNRSFITALMSPSE
jgi:8-oxo-dGTP pyrophosphatase MutT (NUDIX family)